MKMTYHQRHSGCPEKKYGFAVVVKALMGLVLATQAHAFVILEQNRRPRRTPSNQFLPVTRQSVAAVSTPFTSLGIGKIFIINLDDDDDEKESHLENEEEDDEEEDGDALKEDPYTQVAASEFTSSSSSSSSANTGSSNGSNLARANNEELSTNLDWGGALGKLRQRLEDLETGKAGQPSQALFRLLSAQSPNQMIGNFVSTAKPEIVQAMSGAVGSLLGGLSSPTNGIETIVKSTGDKIGSLCFQLQMTGYMFRNAEYVVALKRLMKIRGTATLQEYQDAFHRLDTDKNGYIEVSEVTQLLDDVYDGKTPQFEIAAFMEFFDQNNDGKISWKEFERGLGAALAAQTNRNRNLLSASGDHHEDDEDEDDDEDPLAHLGEPEISGTIEIELEDGKSVEIDAKEYIDNLKKEAKALKDELARRQENPPSGSGISGSLVGPQSANEFSSITGYIASLQGNVKALTEGISPEIVETMKMLVDFVLEGGESRKGKDIPKEEIEMEIPGSALQQLALWQLILGYRLREAEAKGDYLKLLE